MAAKTIGVHLNLSRQELQNAVVQKLSSAPSSPVEGLIYYDTTLKQFGVYQNTAWVYLAVAGTDQNAVKDIVGGMLAPGSSTISGSYNSGTRTLTLSIASGSITDSMVNGSAAISADKLADSTNFKIMTAAERTKLAGVATGATNYTDSNARANRLDQFAAPTSAVTWNGQKITSLADPTSAQDAATKNYVDSSISTSSGNDRNRANHTGTQTASTISDFDTQVRTSRLDQLAAPTSTVSLNNQRITGLQDPTAATDAATKQYVDAAAVGIDFKPSVRALAGANLDLSAPGATIGGVTMATGDRFLANAQTTASQNGIYVWNGASAAATRASDANSNAKVTPGMLTYVEEGGGQGQQWILTTTGSITLGTTSLVFTQFSGASTLTAGAGLTPSGNTFNVGQGTGIIVTADAVSIDTGLVTRKAYFTFGDGSATAFTLTHNWGVQDVMISIRDTSTNEIGIDYQVVASSANSVTVTTNAAPASGAFRAVVFG